MSAVPSPPEPMPDTIPYPGHHRGDLRTLTLTAHRGLGGPRWIHVGIDGFVRVMPWGTAHFEVPAGRPVHVSVSQVGHSITGVATTTLLPSAPPILEYRAPAHRWFDGEIGAPGTPRTRGCWLPTLCLGLLVLVVAFLLLVVV